MTSEYELDCATCGTSLTRREVPGESLGFGGSDAPELGDSESLEVAECPDCGGRYFPETTLERLET
ncbi:zf-TFIIB domain-containing protein [Halorussus salinus]|uniref:zf-TFIIB domain-containing protein n=1 Tax=Halorussus salinus TaxID=1364935 RepID=UPI001091D1DD|nr:zf-TFIIB domain-containing protein [Halorussus salinus]